MNKEIIGYPEITYQDEWGFSVTMRLTRRDKKIWGEVLGLPKYKITEWAFPKKKKRGSMRRSRYEDCSSKRLEEEMAQIRFDL